MAIEPTDRFSVYSYVAVIVVVSLILTGSLLVLLPFLSAILLAIILCIATWPAYRWLCRQLGGRMGIASLLMTILLAALFVAPLVFIGSSLVESFRSAIDYAMEMAKNGPPQLPDWVAGIPFAGPHIVQGWEGFTSDRAHMMTAVRDYSYPIRAWLLVFGSGIGHGALQLLLGLFISFFLFKHGAAIVVRTRALIYRFGGERSLALLEVTERTLISLVYGIIGTALVFAALSTAAFYIAEVPGAPLLGLLMFFLGIIPGAPPILLVPVIVWLFYDGHVGMGIFMIVYSVVAMGLMDVVIKPYFISLGTKMPSIMILLGVLGGVATFGFMGLFIGPALLSVAYAMITEWSETKEPAHV